MAHVFLSRLVLLTALTAGGCTTHTLFPGAEPNPAESPASPSLTEAPPGTAPPDAPSEPPAENSYANAINRASNAVSLSQSARSKDDWRLVASRWQQAIALLEAVPDSDANSQAAAQKLPDYRRNLAYAQQQAEVPIPEVEPGRVVRISPNSENGAVGEPDAVTSAATSAPPDPSGQQTTRSADGRQQYQAPIVRRAGGTPVILATFNGNQSFEMIVDTGASGTVITQSMAQALSVDPVGEAKVTTASARDVPFQLGYVSSLEVAGANVDELLVAIAGPNLAVGLLGQDFFGTYDVTIRQNVVEFRER